MTSSQLMYTVKDNRMRERVVCALGYLKSDSSVVECVGNECPVTERSGYSVEEACCAVVEEAQAECVDVGVTQCCIYTLVSSIVLVIKFSF